MFGEIFAFLLDGKKGTGDGSEGQTRLAEGGPWARGSGGRARGVPLPLPYW